MHTFFYHLHLAASTKAVLITLRGSMIPSFTMSTYTPVLHKDHYYLSHQENKKGEKWKNRIQSARYWINQTLMRILHTNMLEISNFLLLNISTQQLAYNKSPIHVMENL